MDNRRFGLSAALAMPFAADGAIDFPHLAAHAGWCLAHGCDSVTAFGTTGEGASLGDAERDRALGALAGAGIAAGDVVGGISAASVEAAAAQARAALDFGCRALLVPPPFYFKGVDEDGLYGWFAALIERIGPGARDLVLYNIPSVTAVALPVPMIARLAAAFPGIVVGVKDSSGDWAYTERLLAARGTLRVLVGDERHLARAVRLGGDGAISGLANLMPAALRPLAVDGTEDRRVVDLVDALSAHPVIPSVKALIAARTGDAGWTRVRPPLTALDPAALPPLRAAFDACFTAAAA